MQERKGRPVKKKSLEVQWPSLGSLLRDTVSSSSTYNLCCCYSYYCYTLMHDIKAWGGGILEDRANGPTREEGKRRTWERERKASSDILLVFFAHSKPVRPPVRIVVCVNYYRAHITTSKQLAYAVERGKIHASDRHFKGNILFIKCLPRLGRQTHVWFYDLFVKRYKTDMKDGQAHKQTCAHANKRTDGRRRREWLSIRGRGSEQVIAKPNIYIRLRWYMYIYDMAKKETRRFFLHS